MLHGLVDAGGVDEHHLSAATLRMPMMRCRVVCGLSDTIATFGLTNR
jgi:hypothetical protein